jgi:hypothetical protein
LLSARLTRFPSRAQVDAGVESVHGAFEFRLLCVSVPINEVVGLRELGPPRAPPPLPPRPHRTPAADAAATPVRHRALSEPWGSLRRLPRAQR